MNPITPDPSDSRTTRRAGRPPLRSCSAWRRTTWTAPTGKAVCARRRALSASDRRRRVPARPPPRHPRRRHGARQDAAGDRVAAPRLARRAVSRGLPRIGEAQLGARDRAGDPGASVRVVEGSGAAPVADSRMDDRELRHPVEAHRRARARAVGGARVRRGALPEEPHERAQPARAAARGTARPRRPRESRPCTC